MGKVLETIACPDIEGCGSSDACRVYEGENGSVNATCFSCNQYFHDPYQRGSNTETGSNTVTPKTPTERGQSHTLSFGSIDECLHHPVRELVDRSISHAACERYGVRVGLDPRDGSTPIFHLYPVSKNRDITGFKQRVCSDKSFRTIGDCKNVELFGSNVVNPTGKKLFITEGELDALSLYQVLKEQSSIDWEPSVVSLPNGASCAVRTISENMDLIEGYEEIVLVFDQDAPGKQATKDVCKILAGKVYVAKLTEKDPNEMLMKGKGTDLKWAVLTNAKKYQPDGILDAGDCWSRYKDSNNSVCYPYPSTMAGLTEKTYGCRPGSIVTVTSGSGCGKTQFLRELKYHYYQSTDFKIADIALEEDVGDTIGGMLSLHLNKRISLPDVKVTEEVEKQAFDELFGSGRFTLYDFFGGMDDDTLFSKLRYFTSTGHNIIFLDHLSIVVSEFASQGGERERIDTIMTKLAKLVKETGAIIFLVVHLKKSDSSKRSFEEGATPTLDDLRGSASIKQLSWDVLGLSRNQQHPDVHCANTTELTVLKCRFTGRTGSAGFLKFDETTGRMLSTVEPANYREFKK